MTSKFNFINNSKNLFHIVAYVPAGSIYEKEKKGGLSHLLEHMILKHTKQYTEIELLKEMSNMGGNYNAVTDRDVTYYYIMTHVENYKKCIDLFKSFMKEPVFTQKELDVERKVVIEEYKKRLDNDGDLFNLSYYTILGPDNKYLKSVDGTIEELEKITLSDLRSYFTERYKEIIYIINCDKKYQSDITRYVLKKLGPNKIVDFNNIKELYDGTLSFKSNLFIMTQPSSQYITTLLFPAFPKHMVKENIILDFIKYTLVSSGLYSILTYQLRSKRGIIYSVACWLEVFRYIGLIRFIIRTSNKNTEHVLSIIFDILNKMKRTGIKKSSFDYFKKGFLNELKYNFTNDNYKTMFFGESLFYGVDISEEQYLTIVNKITNDDIKNIANIVFDFTKIGVLTYGEYKNKTAMEKLITEQVGSYIMLQNDKYISS
jgi:predicted Zn-dependent peptidase